MKKTILLLLLFFNCKLALAIDPDNVRAAYKKLNLEITDDKTVIEKQYQKLISVDGVAFLQEGKEIRAARELIITFIKDYGIEILTKSNKSFIFKNEPINKGASLKVQFMKLMENNAHILKFAFTAPYSGANGEGAEEGFRRASRMREAIYPAYHEIHSFYRGYYEKDLTSVDLKMLSAALGFQINSKISVINEIKEVYENLSDSGKEIYTMLMTLLAGEGSRQDIEDISKRTKYFLYQIKAMREVSQTITDTNLMKFKKLYQKMPMKPGLIGSAYAPYYFDTIVLLNNDPPSHLLVLAPKEINEKYFLFHGTLAPFILKNLNSEQRNALNSLIFQLASLLKKDLDSNEFLVVNDFDRQKKRIALVLDIAGMTNSDIHPEVLNMNVEELEKLKASYFHEGKTSCTSLMKDFF
jgi:hypothetical protein